MKEVCSCGAKFDTLDELYQHINTQMGTDYSPDEFSTHEGAEGLTPEQQQRLSVLFSAPHHGYTMTEG